MKSLASLTLLFLVAAQEPPPGDGPRGSSQLAAGEVRYDAVGYAGRGDMAGVSAASTTLPPGSYAEVTALDTGRTIVVAMIDGPVASNRIVMLSGAAATALGMADDGVAVRVRRVTPTPQDVVQLRAGHAASFRAEAPPALLAALRKQLVPVPAAGSPQSPPRKTVAAAVAKPRPLPMPKAPASAARGYVVQVAAFSSADRAATVARAIGGSVVAGPPLWRVRVGPFADTAAAVHAKAEAARKGYPGGQITRIP